MISDADTLLAAEREQAAALTELQEVQAQLANAIVVVKVMKERIEGAEMRLTAEFLRRGDSAAAAKIQALADERYARQMKQIFTETEQAQAVILRADLLRERLQSAREIMANQRKQMGL